MGKVLRQFHDSTDDTYQVPLQCDATESFLYSVGEDRRLKVFDIWSGGTVRYFDGLSTSSPILALHALTEGGMLVTQENRLTHLG